MVFMVKVNLWHRAREWWYSWSKQIYDTEQESDGIHGQSKSMTQSKRVMVFMVKANLWHRAREWWYSWSKQIYETSKRVMVFTVKANLWHRAREWWYSWSKQIYETSKRVMIVILNGGSKNSDPFTPSKNPFWIHDFPESVGVCVAFLSRRAFRQCRKELVVQPSSAEELSDTTVKD